MATCPYCDESYAEYSIIGILPANEHLTDWLEPVPLAQLVCRGCGRYTFMHPDHPDVQRLPRVQHYEAHENVRTLNVDVESLGDPELREQFEHGL